MRRLWLCIMAVGLVACDPTKKIAPTFSVDGKYVLQSIGGFSMPFEYFALVGSTRAYYDTLYIDTLRVNTDSTWREWQHHRMTTNGVVTTSVMIYDGRWSQTGDTVTFTTGPDDVNGPHVVSGPWVPGVLTLLWSTTNAWVYYGGDH